MMGIKCGAQFRLRHALGMSLRHRKCASIQPVTAMNSVRGVLPGPRRKSRQLSWMNAAYERTFAERFQTAFRRFTRLRPANLRLNAKSQERRGHAHTLD